MTVKACENAEALETALAEAGAKLVSTKFTEVSTLEINPVVQQVFAQRILKRVKVEECKVLKIVVR